MQRASVSDRIRLFGIRHHGPGSALSLVAALDEWQPQAVLVEGPAEAAELVPFLVDESLVTPVAMLFYASDKPGQAVYYPAADFSPELQAFRWATKNAAPIRFIDLPASVSLCLSVSRTRSSDVLDQVAEAAGFEDTQEWWDHLVESRSDPAELFAGIQTLMTELRQVETLPEPGAQDSVGGEDDDDGRRRISHIENEALREAHMRKSLREALAEEYDRIAVVCGAWHVPALAALGPAKADDALLKGLPKVKVRATLVPWTFDRMTSASGYGAGARSPAYYDLIFRTPAADIPTAWLLSVARLMRSEDLDASPASVIEAVRLADALASLRNRPRPGLRELSHAAGSALIPDDSIWNLIGRRLIVGDRMGSVPENVPMIPLQSDLAAQQKRLRLQVDGTDRTLELDLRGEIDLQRSHLFHRLNLLGVAWGVSQQVTGKKGTFHEHWRVMWRPELAIALIEASIYGNTVQEASSKCARQRAAEAKGLAEVSRIVEQVLVADLPDAMQAVVGTLEEIAATHSDVADLADALPPLAAIARYGTVRRTEADRVLPVLDAIFTRLCIGLPGACLSLDDESAEAMIERLDGVNGVVGIFDDAEKKEAWRGALASVATLNGVHTLISGKAERLRFDIGAVDGEHLAIRLGQAASIGSDSRETAAFVQGLLDGPGAILLHQEPLFRAVDEWLSGLDLDVFEEILPLIRRSFSLFTRPERRQIGERVSDRVSLSIAQTDIDEERARRPLPIIRLILGLSESGTAQ